MRVGEADVKPGVIIAVVEEWGGGMRELVGITELGAAVPLMRTFYGPSPLSVYGGRPMDGTPVPQAKIDAWEARMEEQDREWDADKAEILRTLGL